MTKQHSNSSLDVVTALMEERAKFETWLAALESRRDATPRKVYDRVREDYEHRLSGVVDELKTHAAELEEQAERYTARLSELSDREQGQREARAEAELRAHVGELSSDEWDATAKEADDALAAIAAEQAVVGADLNRVHELLAAATMPPVTPAAAAPALEPTHPAGGVEAEPRRDSDDKPAPAAPGSRTPEESTFDELAFLKSVISPPGSKTPAQAHARPVRPAGPPITQDQSDTLAESLVSRGGRAAPERAFVQDADDDPTAGLVGKAGNPDRVASQPYAANVPGNNPIVLRPSGAVEQPKTLKCTECGAMNYPTEWYCERCGAELAAL